MSTGLTENERVWRVRLLELALQASHENLPCIEQGLLVIVTVLYLKTQRQRVMARVFRDLAEVIDDSQNT